jgi:hypothetical protein
VKNKVNPTLDYLTKLNDGGSKVVDVLLTTYDENTRKMQVFLRDGEVREYLMDDSPQVILHYREAIEFSGYGPKGLSNLIYMDALQFAREQKLRNGQVEVVVSNDCFERAAREIERYLSYGFGFRMNPKMSGMSWTFRKKE